MSATSLDKTRTSLAEAMRRVAMTVSIISAGDNKGRQYAMTATSAISVSLNPESMLVCINKNTLFSSIIGAADRFAVNLLSTAQVALSKDCAGGLPQDSRVNDRDWEIHTDGLALLKGAQASILCRKTRLYEHGTHNLLIGDVYDIVVHEYNDTLLYMDGKYGKFIENK